MPHPRRPGTARGIAGMEERRSQGRWGMNDGAVRGGPSTARLIALATLRVFVGWHFLYEGLVKLFNPHWTAAEYLAQSQGPFSGGFPWLGAGRPRPPPRA